MPRSSSELPAQKGLPAYSVLQLLGFRTPWLSIGDGGGEYIEYDIVCSCRLSVRLWFSGHDVETSVTDGLWPVGGDRTPATGISERLL